ncbi:hypothetical protein TRVL_01555 [Trypanosoma vivax]|nr:hypothetical protein TRVL_01555 [Trypanosoma vivax]
MVEKGIYRSAYPTLASVPYLRHIGIRTVVLLSIELLPGPVARALAGIETTNATHEAPVRHGDSGRGRPICVVCTSDLTEWMNEYVCSKDDFSVSGVQYALDFALQTDLQPVLFTCPTGEIQTNVVVGCMRRYQGWSVAAALSECQLFVDITRSVRAEIMNFIEQWNPEEHPVRDADIASRRRELMLCGHQLDYCKKWGQRNTTLSAYNSDSDAEDYFPLASNKATTRGSPDDEGAAPTPQRGRAIAHQPQSSGVTNDGGAMGASTSSHEAVVLAPWYTATLARRAAVANAIALSRLRIRGPTDPLPEPHERYFGVLNPPALDERSTFTKESIVEDVD